jgi:two-component system cell cycle response regulator CtrA
MRVLLIEDEPVTAEALALMLAGERCSTDKTGSGEEGIALAKVYDYDIILLDLHLPDMTGYDVMVILRAANIPTPVLVVSGAVDTASRIRALDLGADDFVAKPFDCDELMARIRAVVRRSRGHSQSVIRTGELAVNLDAKTVEADGVPLHVTRKEYEILELLSLRKGLPVSKEMFLNHLYGGLDEPDPRVIDVYVCALRKKLSQSLGKEYISTLWGRGYRLSDDADEGRNVARSVA